MPGLLTVPLFCSIWEKRLSKTILLADKRAIKQGLQFFFAKRLKIRANLQRMTGTIKKCGVLVSETSEYTLIQFASNFKTLYL